MWGPKTAEIPLFLQEIPYAPYSRQERLGKVADWTFSSEQTQKVETNSMRRRRQEEQALTQQLLSYSQFTYQHQDPTDDSFSLVDRQQQTLRKSAVRSTRKGKAAPVKAVLAPKKQKYGQVLVKPRDPSVKIAPHWSLVEELAFTRMNKLWLDVEDPEDLCMSGKVNYYDKAYDKVTSKTETNLQSSDKPLFNPTASSDKKLLELAQEQSGPVVISTDSTLAALMTCLKSVYSWDLNITKVGDRIYLDKRDLCVLDFDTVNENAAEPPAASTDKESNINSHEALAREATTVSRSFSQQIVSKDQPLEFNEPYPFNDENSNPESSAYRYRKWDLGDFSLLLRTHVQSAMHTKNTNGLEALQDKVVDSAHPLGESCLVNVFSLLEFDSRALGSGGSFDWRKKLDTQRGAVVATEMKNNSCKLARWTCESLMSGVEYMRLGFVSRTGAKDRKRHQILGSMLVRPDDFCKQISFNLQNGWGIVKAILDLCFGLDDGKYVLLREPVKQLLSLYKV